MTEHEANVAYPCCRCCPGAHVPEAAPGGVGIVCLGVLAIGVILVIVLLEDLVLTVGWGPRRLWQAYRYHYRALTAVGSPPHEETGIPYRWSDR